jgi:hypothetical protein
MTFSGFSALIMVLRQTSGGGMSKYDAFLTTMYIQAGFLVSAGGLLPPMLAGTGWLGSMAVWRSASAVIAAPAALFLATYPARRRKASGTGLPAFARVNFALLLVALVALVLNAVGWPLAPGFGSYAGALTWLMLLTLNGYLQSLSVLFGQHLGR